jgi:hypothetical protein
MQQHIGSTGMTFIRYGTALVIGIGLAAGCSSRGPGHGEPVPPVAAALQEVADLLRAADPAGRPPSKLADLERFKGLYLQGYEAVKAGDVVVLWGAALRGEGDKGGRDAAVAAYEKSAPTEGGYVLLTSGEVKKMTAAEFQAAPKAGKS